MKNLVLQNSAQNNLIEFFENVVIAKGLLNADDVNAYRSGLKVLKTTDLFLRKRIDLSGIVEVINENDVELQAISNLSKGRVPSEKNIILAGMQLKYGFTTVANTAPSSVAYTSSIFNLGALILDPNATGGTVYAPRIPLNLQNAEFKASCDDVVFDEGRASQFLAENVSNYGVDANAENNRVIIMPKLLKADKTLRFTIKFPENLAAPVGFHYVEVAYRGLELTKRS